MNSVSFILQAKSEKVMLRLSKTHLLWQNVLIFFFTDTGNKHNTEDFWKLYSSRKDNGLVVGIKTNRTDQWYRKFLTWAYNLILSYYFKIKLTDADAGFRLYKLEAAQKVFHENWINRDLINSEITLRIKYSGYSIKEVPIFYRQRKGESRGLPLKKMPGATYRVLRNFRQLRRTLSDPGYNKEVTKGDE